MSSDGAKLIHAAGAGNDAKVKRLLKAKVDVNYNMIGEAGGITPLYAACGLGHVGAAQLLLKAKATVDLPTNEGCTSLYIACQNALLDCARLLLQAKAEVDPPAPDGSTPLIVAAELGHAPVVQLLLDAKASTSARWDKGTALDVAPRREADSGGVRRRRGAAEAAAQVEDARRQLLQR
jgi:ankyrin repeat protein